MNTLSSSTNAMLADIVLAGHVLVVGFVVLGQMLFMAGGWAGWLWVRNLWTRLVHLALIGFVVLQSWWGAVCPLTLWEQALRRQAGQSGYGESFIAHWLSRLIFFSAPPWIFVLVYSVFGGLVVLTWWWLPPHRRRQRL